MKLPDVEVAREAAMLYLAGTHEKCGRWCLAKKAEMEGKPWNKPPMFNLKLPHNNKTWSKVKEVFEKAKTKERLIEMQHHFTTQANELLNMRAAEVAVATTTTGSPNFRRK